MKLFLFLVAGVACAQNWSPFGRLHDARFDACAVQLAPGTVLITGGSSTTGILASAEILHADGSITAAASMNSPRTRHACTLLLDGRVLITGGASDVEVYDPAADSWTAIPARARSGVTATLLTDGRVLLAGGYTADTPLDWADLFDPATNTLSASPAQMREPRRAHAATRLADGRVLLAGGVNSTGTLRTTEIFDPIQNAFVNGPGLSHARSAHTATLLDDGRVLVAGGSVNGLDLNTAEIIDTDAQSSTLLLARLGIARSGHVAVLVPGNGGVVLAGGTYQEQPLAATEIFRPGPDNFAFLGNLLAPRAALAAAPLDEGLILAMGGSNASGAQAGCGILPQPSLSFTSTSYHAGETARVSGSNLPANVSINLSLELVQNGTAASIASRLLTSRVTTTQGSGSLPLGGFGPVSIVNVLAGDAGGQFRLTASAGTVSLTRTVPVKAISTLSIRLPDPVLEGHSHLRLRHQARRSERTFQRHAHGDIRRRGSIGRGQRHCCFV